MNCNNRELGKTKVNGEYDSKSDSDDVMRSPSVDDQNNIQHERRKLRHRHTPQQLHELEA